MLARRRRFLALAAALLVPVPALAGEGPIQDNSFLLEEAYNQEPGVIQHISAFQWMPQTGDWAYTFTEEWPVFGQMNQLSLTVPIQRIGEATGVGDLLVNYRLQAIGSGETRVAFSPRLSAIVPTGSVEDGLGMNAFGLQTNLPLSVMLAPWLVSHSNVGATVFFGAENAAGDEATVRGFNAGQSLIWLAHPNVNVMTELAWSTLETVTGPGERGRASTLYFSPGLRAALNFSSGLQIVPGVAVPIGIGPSAGDVGVFAYLSFEHPLKRPGQPARAVTAARSERGATSWKPADGRAR